MTSLLPLLALLTASPDTNLISLESGGIVVDAPGWDGIRAPESFVGTDQNGRSSSDGKGPFSVVYELEQRSALISVDVRNTRSDGRSPSTLEVWVSSAGPVEGFTRVGSVTMKGPGIVHANFPKETLGRWVRLVAIGKEDVLASELMEVSVNGHPLEPSPVRSFAGSWRLEGQNMSSGGVLRLVSDGAAVSGCATWSDRIWTVKGTAHGRSAGLVWVDEIQGNSGTAVATLGDEGALRGSSRDDGNNSSTSWVGLKRPEVPFDCRTAMDEQRLTHRMSRSSNSGSLTLGGVGFDASSDELKLETRNELVALERLLSKGDQAPRVRLMVVGRTSEPPADELKRCERRAQRLLRHLEQNGVPAGSVEIGVGIVRFGAVQLDPHVELFVLGG